MKEVWIWIIALVMFFSPFAFVVYFDNPGYMILLLVSGPAMYFYLKNKFLKNGS